MIDWQTADPVVKLLAGKWVLPILRQLAQGPKGHNELMRALNVQHKPLDRSLRRLEAAQVVTREVQPTPLRVRYRLTDQAEPLLRALDELATAGRDLCAGKNAGEDNVVP